MTVRPKPALVLSSRQLIVAQVAVVLCSGVREQELGGWEHYRVPLGDAFDRMARRLHAARELDDASGAMVVDLLDRDGRSILAIELPLSQDELAVLRVAVDRLRGLLARSGEFDGALDEDLDDVAAALDGRLA